jgi:hypothetical protein
MPTRDAQTSRPPFGALFADARTYRGDCALLRRAIRRGWLHAAPQANRDTVLKCFERADAVRAEAQTVSSEQLIRVAICTVLTAVAWDAEAQREEHAVIDWLLGCGPEPKRAER